MNPHFGSQPDWYPHIAAAKYLGVPPWELSAQPECWKTWALAGLQAEAEAARALQSRG